ncbi:SPOR domain-containing protein [Trinickia terrae]|uniref:SPOR domain-containing protein n=1 Tax=Trinickia terrae TaxID=2571161 RepID=A0A4U1IET8_9BURK|nr:SPOR domain-containing protein [Trinickia terrae]TKC92157.1 SPOR domain-containing protein [Trinickia terrae]
MGLFSFGNKDDAPGRRGANASSRRSSRTESSPGARVERRTRRTERAGDVDAMMLDPTLPEKQRARRRLVGAIALVVAAVVVLPMVLDSHPKPVTDDISIDIPNRPAHEARAAGDDDTQAGVAPDNPTPEATAAASGVALAAPSASVAGADKAAASGLVTQQAAAQANSKSPVQSSGAQAAGQSTKQAANTAAPQASTKKPATAPAQSAAAKPQAPAAQPAQQSAANTAAPSAPDADSGTPAAPLGARFAVQLGSFPDDATARNWAAKLKAAGVPAYTEHYKQPNGSMRTLLRAGPFADRAAASAAIAKVREAGLAANAGSGSAQ